MKGILVLLILASLFVFGVDKPNVGGSTGWGSIAYQFTPATHCVAPGSPQTISLLQGGYIYERTGQQTFRVVSAYLVYPNIKPGSGYYYSPSQSGIIYDADNTPVAIITGGVS